MMPNYRRAREAALDLLLKAGVSAPPVDPVTIAKMVGVQVYFAKFANEDENVSGLFDAEDDMIFVNEDEYPLRQNFTIAHELAHKVLHEEWARSQDYKVLYRNGHNDRDFREKEADVFAANLLAPRFMLDMYWPSVKDESRLSQIFAVSVPAMKARLGYEYGV